MISRGTGLNTDSRRMATHSPVGWLQKLGYGREELGPSRSPSENRWSSAAGHDVMGCDVGKETTLHAEMQPG